MYERGGEQTAEGVLCKTRDIDANVKSENWTHIRGTDDQFCDKTKNCENGLDEPDFCQRVIVSGSGAKDGVYKTTSPTTYKQQGGNNIIFMAANNRWMIAEGPNPQNASVLYKTRESNTALVKSSWENVLGKPRIPGSLSTSTSACSSSTIAAPC